MKQKMNTAEQIFRRAQNSGSADFIKLVLQADDSPESFIDVSVLVEYNNAGVWLEKADAE